MYRTLSRLYKKHLVYMLLYFAETVLATSTKHLAQRLKADVNYRRNAQRMVSLYNTRKCHNVKSFTAGDLISIKIPRIDKSSTDLRRMPCIVVDVKGIKQRLSLAVSIWNSQWPYFRILSRNLLWQTRCFNN